MNDRRHAFDLTADKIRGSAFRQQVHLLNLHSAIAAVPGCSLCQYTYGSVAFHIKMLVQAQRFGELAPIADAEFVSSYLRIVAAEEDAIVATDDLQAELLDLSPGNASILSLYRLVLLGARQLGRLLSQLATTLNSYRDRRPSPDGFDPVVRPTVDSVLDGLDRVKFRVLNGGAPRPPAPAPWYDGPSVADIVEARHAAKRRRLTRVK